MRKHNEEVRDAMREIATDIALISVILNERDSSRGDLGADGGVHANVMRSAATIVADTLHALEEKFPPTDEMRARAGKRSL